MGIGEKRSVRGVDEDWHIGGGQLIRVGLQIRPDVNNERRVDH